MEGKKLSSLLSKLRQPLHITYISKYILKEDLETTQKELDDLVEEGLIIKYLYSYVNGEKNGWMSILGFKVGWTKEPLFSVRHGYTKSIKIKDYYFTLK